MNAIQALAFVERHGVVLESARHATIPSIAQAIAGKPIRGSWWAHAQGREIFAVTRALRGAAQILTCRIVEGHISFVHERLWPALARLAERFPPARLSRLQEVHTSRGRHRTDEVAFPLWLPLHVAAEAGRLEESEAQAHLAPLLHVSRDPT
ncbi:MAG: hypothetical protein EOP90_10445 [Lysobacteraceae bacterium]|nr:MAG: hypothetical protein EOP90_10445 [Xanthomonadaceae bacterium]